MGEVETRKGPEPKAGMLWRRRDVMDYLGVDEKVIRAMVESGKLRPVTGLGKRAFFRRSEVMQMAAN